MPIDGCDEFGSTTPCKVTHFLGQHCEDHLSCTLFEEFRVIRSTAMASETLLSGGYKSATGQANWNANGVTKRRTRNSQDG